MTQPDNKPSNDDHLTEYQKEIERKYQSSKKELFEEINKVFSRPTMPITIYEKDFKDKHRSFIVSINFDPYSFVVGISHFTIPGVDAGVVRIHFLPLFYIGIGFQTFKK